MSINIPTDNGQPIDLKQTEQAAETALAASGGSVAGSRFMAGAPSSDLGTFAGMAADIAIGMPAVTVATGIGAFVSSLLATRDPKKKKSIDPLVQLASNSASNSAPGIFGPNKASKKLVATPGLKRKFGFGASDLGERAALTGLAVNNNEMTGLKSPREAALAAQEQLHLKRVLDATRNIKENGPRVIADTQTQSTWTAHIIAKGLDNGETENRVKAAAPTATIINQPKMPA